MSVCSSLVVRVSGVVNLTSPENVDFGVIWATFNLIRKFCCANSNDIENSTLHALCNLNNCLNLLFSRTMLQAARAQGFFAIKIC